MAEVYEREIRTKSEFDHAISEIEVARLSGWVFGILIRLADVNVIDFTRNPHIVIGRITQKGTKGGLTINV